MPDDDLAQSQRPGAGANGPWALLAFLLLFLYLALITLKGLGRQVDATDSAAPIAKPIPCTPVPAPQPAQ